MTKPEIRTGSRPGACFAFVIGISDFLRHWTFVIRHSHVSASIGSTLVALPSAASGTTTLTWIASAVNMRAHSVLSRELFIALGGLPGKARQNGRVKLQILRLNSFEHVRARVMRARLVFNWILNKSKAGKPH